MKMLRQILGPFLALLLTFGSVAEVSAPVTVAAAGVMLGVGQAQAATPAQKAVVLNGVPGWVLRASGALPSIDMDFAHNRAWVGGSGPRAPPSLLTTTRASTGYAQWADGHLSSFAANIPRITDLGLLVEQAATNLALRSQDFSNAYWTKNNSTSVAAASTAPDGTVTASSFIEAANTAQHSIFSLNAVALTSGVTYTVSTYVKVLSGTRSFVLFPQGGGSADAVFNLQLGTVTSTGGSQYVSSGIAALGSGWYRCWVTFTASSTANNSPNIYLSNDGTASPSYAGDGASGVYLWGFQFETGSFPTSYIPTTTVSVARAADAITFKNLNLPAPYSLFFSAGSSAKDTADLLLGGTVNDGSLLRTSGGSGVLNVVEGGVTTASITAGTMTVNTPFKMAGRFAVNDANLALGGTIGTHDTSTTPPTLTALGFGRALYGFGSDVGSVYFTRTTLYRSGLSDGQLQAISR